MATRSIQLQADGATVDDEAAQLSHGAIDGLTLTSITGWLLGRCGITLPDVARFLLFGVAERRVITALMVHRYGGCVEAAASWTRQKWIW